jgi:UDP-N-acetylglucosamine 2-epimerase (non-hydrolysing)
VIQHRVLAIAGTRPEAIKMAPVILALRDEPWADVRVVATAQHREMLDQVLRFFSIEADVDLNIMRPDQSLTELTSRLLVGLGEVLDAEKPDAVLAQGDTTTTMAAALACFYRQIPFGHVEAGLRTGNINYPFPEEANRVIAGYLAQWHFAPTEMARQNLLRSGIADTAILVTGNTVIDALYMAAARHPDIGLDLPADGRLVLVTAHRRENFGAPFRSVCTALRRLAEANPDIIFLYPVHPNPNVSGVAYEMLDGYSNVHLCSPLDYAPFVAAMKRACLIISDSGGVQEEAPALGKPVLVLRNETERPEALHSGLVQLVGTDEERIVSTAQRLLDDPAGLAASASSPYGDGQAAARIARHVGHSLGAAAAPASRAEGAQAASNQVSAV